MYRSSDAVVAFATGLSYSLRALLPLFDHDQRSVDLCASNRAPIHSPSALGDACLTNILPSMANLSNQSILRTGSELTAECLRPAPLALSPAPLGNRLITLNAQVVRTATTQMSFLSWFAYRYRDWRLPTTTCIGHRIPSGTFEGLIFCHVYRPFHQSCNFIAKRHWRPH